MSEQPVQPKQLRVQPRQEPGAADLDTLVEMGLAETPPEPSETPPPA